MPIHLKLAQFEGPLELLLSLIEERKLDITRVSLAEVANQYLSFIATEKNIPLENLSAFLVIAARLILLKSKMLLPILEFTEEEEEAIEDLELRLQEYKQFREAAEAIGAMMNKNFRSFPREKFVNEAVVFAPPRGMTTEILRNSFETLLGDIPIREQVEEAAIEEVMSLEQKIAELKESIATRAEYSFHEALHGAESRMEIVVSFLAILELVKQRVIIVNQGDLFGAIHIIRSMSEKESVSHTSNL